MKISARILIIPILFSLAFTSAHAQELSVSDSIDVFLKTKMRERNIPALQIAVVKNDKMVKDTTFGIANLEYNIKANNETVFSINSITKAFVGIAIMQLSEAGKLKISDPISLHLDGLPEAWKKITIKQAMSHISGLPDMMDADEQVLGHNDEREAMEKVKALPMAFNPGEKFSYNQTGYVLLGQLITKLSGMHFTQFIQERQFDVAGMPLTRFGDSYDVIPNYAGAYTMTRQMGDNFVRNKVPGHAYMQFPVFFRTAAGIQSTATDLARWIMAINGGKLLKRQSSIDSLWKPAVLNNGKIGGFNRLTNGYALGWPTVTREEHPAVGPVGGGRSALFVYLKDNLSIVVLTNLMQGNPDQFIDEIAGYYIPEMHQVNGFGLPPNLKKLRAELLKKGFEKGVEVISELKKKDRSFHVSENELNGWGYQLLSQKNFKAALSVFKLNVSMYPQSANAYDSLAETFEMLDNKAEAMANYKKSLALDQKNKHAAERIDALTKN